jgi:hypothetical protein
MDLYSLAIMCFWLVFGERLAVDARLSHKFLDYDEDLLAAQCLGEYQTETLLQALKLKGRLPDIAHQILMELDIAPQLREGLDNFFQSNLSNDPTNRIADLRQLVTIMDPHR